jgi:hypothetical protein
VSSLGTVDENAQQALTRIPIGRMGTVTDIAKGIVFLASDDAAFMTGAGLVVDGRHHRAVTSRGEKSSKRESGDAVSTASRLAVGAKGNRTLDLSYVVGALCH